MNGRGMNSERILSIPLPFIPLPLVFSAFYSLDYMLKPTPKGNSPARRAGLRSGGIGRGMNGKGMGSRLCCFSIPLPFIPLPLIPSAAYSPVYA